MNFEEDYPDGLGGYEECVSDVDGVRVTTRLIRVSQVQPGVWVPDRQGTHRVTVEAPPGPHGSGCMCLWCQSVRVGLAEDARRETVRAQARFRSAVYGEFMRNYMSAGDGRGIMLPAGVTGPALSSGYPVLSQAELNAVRAAFLAARNRPPVVLADASEFQPGAGPFAVTVDERPEKTLAESTCRWCGGRLLGQMLVKADKRGNFGYCAANPAGHRAHEPGPPPDGMDPETAIRAAIAAPLGMEQAELDKAAPYGKAPAGICAKCLTGAVTEGTLCWYCNLGQALAPQDPVLRCSQGRPPPVTWVSGACGCDTAAVHEHARELARRRAVCGHRSVRDGLCTRCGAERAAAADPAVAVVLTRYRGLLTMFAVLFLYLGSEGSWLWYIAAGAYLLAGSVLPAVLRSRP